MRIRKYETRIEEDANKNTRCTWSFLASGPKHEFDEIKRRGGRIWNVLWTAADYRRKKRKIVGRLLWDERMTVDEVLEALKFFR